jgi:ABC-2 type transport system ATP-binding protein
VLSRVSVNNIFKFHSYCLIGSSGVGKTTLISCILDQESLDSGQIEIFNRTPKELRNFSHLIGFMPQNAGLSEVLTVKETLRYFSYIHDMSRVSFEERYVLLKCVLNLPDDNFCINNCSGGEKRRISLASSIIHEPKFIILDE